jgi:hypothetical protein
VPRRVVYYEPQAARGEISGAAFVAALKRARVPVRVSRDGRARKGETLVAGLFVGPRAYSGVIRLDGAVRARLAAALRRAEDPVAISFGSPFVLDGLPGAGLCVYSRAPAAQTAAAAHLLGENNE